MALLPFRPISGSSNSWSLIVSAFFMSLGKAAVFKHIPVYYPDRVGAVGGVVGLVGGLGGLLCRSPSAR